MGLTVIEKLMVGLSLAVSRHLENSADLSQMNHESQAAKEVSIILDLMPERMTEFNPRLTEGSSRKLAASATKLGTWETNPKPSQESGSSTAPQTRTIQCVFCHEQHYIDKCTEFMKLPSDGRKAFAKGRGLCFGCLRKGHLYKDCKKKNTSLLQHVQDRQPSGHAGNTASHTGGGSASDRTSVATVMSHSVDVNSDQQHCTQHSLIVPVEVYHEDNPQTKVRTYMYAMMDNQSSASFISDNLLNLLGAVNTKPVSLELTTLITKSVIQSKLVSGLCVRGVQEQTQVQLPPVYSRSVIPVERNLIPRPETVAKVPHLQGVAQKLISYDDRIDVGLLIGFNCSAALMPKEIVSGTCAEDPFAT